MACLAPDIVEAIVAGRELSGLSLERLVIGVQLARNEQLAMARQDTIPHPDGKGVLE